MIIKRISDEEAYRLEDPLNIKRWMCSRCGLVFDYQFDPGELGWPKFDPPLDAVYLQEDENGELQYESPKSWEESCPRCNLNFSQSPFMPVLVSRFTLGSFNKITFVVEDECHKTVVEGIAKQLGKHVAVVKVGNSHNVKSYFLTAKEQGTLANGYFLIDGDNQGPDSRFVNEPNFIQLNKYCIENYLLDFDVCAKITKRSAARVRSMIFNIIKGNPKAIADKGKLVGTIFKMLKAEHITKETLAYFDASQILPEFVKAVGMTEDEFITAYIVNCDKSSQLGKMLPSRIVKIIRSAKS